jgi:pimeloyl-ACP methyl ester carboxylesterase
MARPLRNLVPLLLLPALGALFCGSLKAQDDLPGSVRRYLATGGLDAEAKKAVVRAGVRGADAVLKVAGEGRIYPAAPTGTLKDTCPLTLDRNFRVHYDLYVPPGYTPSKPHALVLYVHGTGSNGFAALRSIVHAFRDRDFILLCPSSEIQGRGWTSTRYERMMQMDALEHVRRSYNVDPLRIYIGGYSRGGHASWIIPMRHPGVFAAAFPMAGGPRLRNFRFLKNYLHTRLRAEWGDRDEWGMVWCDRKASEKLGELGFEPVVIERKGTGHVFRPDFSGIREWLGPIRRPVRPRRVVVAAEHAEEGRSFWIRLGRINERKSKLPPAKKGTMILGGRSVTITVGGVPTPKGFDKRPKEERWQYFVDKSLPYCAEIEAEIKGGNRVETKTRNVSTFTLFVAQELFDLGRPIEVFTNGRLALRRRVAISPGFMLDFLLGSQDWSTVYVAEVKVRVKEGK